MQVSGGPKKYVLVSGWLRLARNAQQSCGSAPRVPGRVGARGPLATETRLGWGQLDSVASHLAHSRNPSSTAVMHDKNLLP